MIPITLKLIPTPSKRRSGQKILGVGFIVSHDTGNDGSTAAQNANYFVSSANEIEASAHYFVDDKQIICCVPEEEKAWHVRYNEPKDNEIYGKDSNDWAIGVELCFHSGNTKVNNLIAYKNYVELHAYLCNKYHLNPLQYVVGHYVLDAARRTDPLNAFKYMNKTWNQFIADIIAFMKPTVPPVSPNEALKAQIKQKMVEINSLIDQIKS
jgi:N-acetylmuramoyl-L-alanine amidase CwlA